MLDQPLVGQQLADELTELLRAYLRPFKLDTDALKTPIADPDAVVMGVGVVLHGTKPDVQVAVGVYGCAFMGTVTFDVKKGGGGYETFGAVVLTQQNEDEATKRIETLLSRTATLLNGDDDGV